jgi:AraC-like DNA-binding protein
MVPNIKAGDATCAIGTLRPLVTALDAMGGHAEAVLAASGLSREQLREPERRISHAHYQDTWLAALDITGDPALGLHVVEHEETNANELLTYIASTAPTRREAFERSRRYTRIAHDALELELKTDGDRMICETRFRGRRSVPVIAEFAVGLIVKMAPRVVGTQPVREAWFQHDEPDHVAEYHRILGVDVKFAAHCNAVVTNVEDLDAPLPHSDEALCELLEEQAAGKLARVPPPDDFAAGVRQRIARALPHGDPSADGVASALGLSGRTLRRRLSALGLSHQQLLDEVRCELAHRALANNGANVSEVAYLLGFSDASAFNKAFRRWTGKRPSDVSTGPRARA